MVATTCRACPRCWRWLDGPAASCANLVIAATVIAVLVTWDLVGHLPLPLAVACHDGSTVLDAFNGARLLP